jgi:hypothetical protein
MSDISVLSELEGLLLTYCMKTLPSAYVNVFFGVQVKFPTNGLFLACTSTFTHGYASLLQIYYAG